MAVATTGLGVAGAAAAPTTSRVSFELDGSQRTNPTFNGSISADGTLVAYEVLQGQPRGPEGPKDDIYLYDRTTGATEWISAGPLGTPGDRSSESPAISANGRFVAFHSGSTNLIPGDPNDRVAVFVRDRRTGGLERIADTRSSSLHSFYPSLSPGGRFVAFTSDGPRAALGGDYRRDVLVRDRKTGQTEVISPTRPRAIIDSDDPSISAGGRFVAFEYGRSIEVRDRALDKTEEITAPGGPQSDPAMSASGRFVAFTSARRHRASEGEKNVPGDIYVHDRKTGATELVSVARDGGLAASFSGGASISPNGRYVAFWSRAGNLVSHDTNGFTDVFVRDRRTGTTRRVSVSSARNQANDESGDLLYGTQTSISARGRYVAFPSLAGNLVQFDTNDVADVFVRGPLTP